MQYFTQEPNYNIKFHDANEQPPVLYGSPYDHDPKFNTKIFTVSETVKQIKKDDPLAIVNQ